MPQIVKKRPYSDIEIDFSKSRTPAELGSEFGLALSPLDVGRGIIMLVQHGSDDEPNFMYEGDLVKGTAFFVKARLTKMGDIEESDMEYIREITKQSASFDW